MTINEVIAELAALRGVHGDVEVVVRDADTGCAFTLRPGSFQLDSKGRIALAHSYTDDHDATCDVPGFY